MDDKAGARILIVDDEKVVRDFLLRFLSKYAKEVAAVENASQALASAKQSSFDIVFLDIRLPEKDGIELLGELKQALPHARYIMMTGYAVDDLLEKAKQQGIYASIRKPFDIDQVLGLIQNSRETDKKNILSLLVVDDDKSVLDFFKRLFGDAGKYRVLALEKGSDALDAIARQDFDLAFLDVVLQDMSGVQLYLKMIETKPNLDVILITGYTDRMRVMEELNIKNCLTKPFEIDKIMAEIERVKRAKGI